MQEEKGNSDYMETKQEVALSKRWKFILDPCCQPLIEPVSPTVPAVVKMVVEQMVLVILV